MSFVNAGKQPAEAMTPDTQHDGVSTRTAGKQSHGSIASSPGATNSRLSELDPALRDRLVEVLKRNGFGFLITSDRHRAATPRPRKTPASAPGIPHTDGAFRFAPAPADILPPQGMNAATKRSLDLVLAAIAVLCLLPVMLAVALAITLEDRGPIVYHQFRTGSGRRPFRFFKFRSMVRNADSIKAALAAENEADGPIFKIRCDPRITRVGRVIRKTSLDELPQLWNVLRGDMSVVGPRPLYTPEAEKLAPSYARRHTVQPGLLCLREVCGRSELSFEEWMELDLIYIESRSLRTDLTILLRAIPAVLSSRGAY